MTGVSFPSSRESNVAEGNMSYVTIPKSCELCGHPLAFFQQYGKSFCPVCEQEALDSFAKWVEQQKSVHSHEQEKKAPEVTEST